MFKTVIQPTGIYGSHPQLLKPNGGGYSNGSGLLTNLDPNLGNFVPRKRRHIGSKLTLASAVIFGVSFGLAGLRKNLFGGNYMKKPFNLIFKRPTPRRSVAIPLKRAFVRVADRCDEYIKTPVSRVLRQNLLGYLDERRIDNLNRSMNK